MVGLHEKSPFILKSMGFNQDDIGNFKPFKIKWHFILSDITDTRIKNRIFRFPSLDGRGKGRVITALLSTPSLTSPMKGEEILEDWAFLFIMRNSLITPPRGSVISVVYRNNRPDTHVLIHGT